MKGFDRIATYRIVPLQCHALCQNRTFPLEKPMQTRVFAGTGVAECPDSARFWAIWGRFRPGCGHFQAIFGQVDEVKRCRTPSVHASSDGAWERRRPANRAARGRFGTIRANYASSTPDEATELLRGANLYKRVIEGHLKESDIPEDGRRLAQKNPKVLFLSQLHDDGWTEWMRLPAGYKHPPQGLAAKHPELRWPS